MTRVDKEVDFDWAFADPVPSLSADTTANSFAVRWTGTIAAPVAKTDDFQIRLPICYPCGGMLAFAIYLDGKPLEPAAAQAQGQEKLPPSGTELWRARTLRDSVHGYATASLRIEYVQSGKIKGGGISFEWSPRHELLQDEAVATAKKADVVIAFVGLTPRLEGEEMQRELAKGFSGGDRTDIGLPDVQEELIEAVAKTGKPMVVVLLNGSALAVNWAQQNAKAILEAWYPGQAGGQAIAETLSGNNNPGGTVAGYVLYRR